MSSGIWKGHHFYVNQQVEECDWWVVYEGLLETDETICDPDHVIFITGEPPTIRSYNEKFLRQFSMVITSHVNIKHPNILLHQQALPWHIGVNRSNLNGEIAVLDFDDFLNIDKIIKNNKKSLSIISSTKCYTDGHKRRLRFVDALIDHFGDQIDVFGRGFNEIEDKWIGIAPYKYHIVIENSYVPDYFSEKLTDTFLGLSYPFYFGCPNIYHYFPKLALTPIDIGDSIKAIANIEELMKMDTFEKRFSQLTASKNLVLNKYNLFPMIASICNKPLEKRRKIIIKPETDPGFDKISYTLRKLIRYIRSK